MVTGAATAIPNIVRRNDFIPWSMQATAQDVPTITHGEGVYFWDNTGKRYLDFSSQLANTNLGHQHPKIVEAIKQQADKLCFIGPHFSNETEGARRRDAGRDRPRGHQHGVFRLKRERGERVRVDPRAPLYRPQQSSRASSLLSRVERGCTRRKRRSAPYRRPLQPSGRGAILPRLIAIAAASALPIRSAPCNARRASKRSSCTKARTTSWPSSSSRSPEPMGRSCRRPNTTGCCAKSATSTGSC